MMLLIGNKKNKKKVNNTFVIAILYQILLMFTGNRIYQIVTILSYMYIYILHFWESIQVLRRGVTTFWEMFGFGKELFYWPTQFWFCAPPGSKITKVWWLRGIRRCSDRLDKIRTHLRVYQLINCILKLPYCANGYVTLTWRPACPPSGRGVSLVNCD